MVTVRNSSTNGGCCLMYASTYLVQCALSARSHITIDIIGSTIGSITTIVDSTGTIGATYLGSCDLPLHPPNAQPVHVFPHTS